jgi:hypothetical protein
MNTFKYQRGLINWFIVNKNKPLTLNSAKNMCLNIFYNESAETDATNWEAFSVILMPLLRFGILEFNGKNAFMLAPSSAIKQNGYILTCNVPDLLLSNYEHSLIFDTQLGIKVYKESREITFTLLHNNIIFSSFNFSKTLNQLQSIDHIIGSWKDAVVIDASNFHFLTNTMNWRKGNNPPNQGIFKKSNEVYSERLIKYSNETWKSIPMRQNNFDSINFALIWHQLKNTNSINVTYSKLEMTIRINSNFFPVIVERLLLFNSLIKSPIKFNVFNREYFLSHAEFDRVSHLFDNKIQLI